MEKGKLRYIIHKKSKGNSNLSAQLYQMYLFEHILDRVSLSKYKNNIILKGGLLLSSIIGDDERTTKDMDATLKNFPLEIQSVEKIISEILHIDTGDNISFEVIDIKDIREDDEYGGFKISILAKMSTLKIHLAIELTTGDKITPREIEYSYNSHFEDRKISILAYTVETIIAEKYQTIIARDIYNTRMKDFYDIYVLVTENKSKINLNNLILAIKNTFAYRNTEIDIEEIKEQLENMKINNRLISLWENYQKTAPYSEKIKYEELYTALDWITNILAKEKMVVEIK